MQSTSNLGLKKPDGTDIVDITVLNSNMDKLDTEVVKVASPTENGRMTAADKTKLNGIAANANNYAHPATHPATMITEDATHRFATDAEKAVWNAKETTAGAQAKVTTHANNATQHVYYLVTAGAANAYTANLPSAVSYIDGLGLALKIGTANTGASTLNLNGLGNKSLLRANGSPLLAGMLKSNSVYTFRYNGTAFILQGEGGEYGTAVAADVLYGKTVGTDNGIVNGSMPNNGVYSITPTTFDQAIPPGYTAVGSVVKGDPDLIAANVKNGISIFNVKGNLIERKMATGTVSQVESPYTGYKKFTVKGLDFAPSEYVADFIITFKASEQYDSRTTVKLTLTYSSYVRTHGADPLSITIPPITGGGGNSSMYVKYHIDDRITSLLADGFCITITSVLYKGWLGGSSIAPESIILTNWQAF